MRIGQLITITKKLDCFKQTCRIKSVTLEHNSRQASSFKSSTSKPFNL